MSIRCFDGNKHQCFSSTLIRVNARFHEPTHLVLVFSYLDDADGDACHEECGQNHARDQTELIGDDCPAEMKELVEHDKRRDTLDDQQHARRLEQPHPQPDAAQSGVSLRIVMFNATDRFSDHDVTHPGVGHANEDEGECGNEFNDTVFKFKEFVSLVQVYDVLHEHKDELSTDSIE